ncbi:hypothetical protein [Halopelagius longus]|uniref:Lipoprotein n=1 Tax=Halopelagius longus TaxID=1236180 RepID=A0A1H1G7V8_9EURY|nr:hypothetical protein [Halopelagius longus]RDI69795.1 hypothetical protein DWB78_16730 [Halopelagius longus]SDR09139.1 hypothetical protein SAMN05216278_3570 [Halopelagius longus]
MRTRFPAVVVALLLLTAGCSALTDDRPPSDERAVDATAKAASALDPVSTYRFALDGTVRASDGDRTRTVDVDGEGVVDTRQRKMASNATVDGRTRRQYLDGYTTYAECAEPWDGWSVENASNSTEWTKLTPLGRQVEILQRSNVYWEGNRTVDGNRTAVVVAHPSKRTLTSLPSVGRTATDLSEADVDNATLRMWIDAETGRPVKSELDVSLSTGGASGELEATTRYYGYGEPANVTIPSSARTDRYEIGCPGE